MAAAPRDSGPIGRRCSPPTSERCRFTGRVPGRRMAGVGVVTISCPRNRPKPSRDSSSPIGIAPASSTWRGAIPSPPPDRRGDGSAGGGSSCSIPVALRATREVGPTAICPSCWCPTLPGLSMGVPPLPLFAMPARSTPVPPTILPILATHRPLLPSSNSDDGGGPASASWCPTPPCRPGPRPASTYWPRMPSSTSRLPRWRTTPTGWSTSPGTRRTPTASCDGGSARPRPPSRRWSRRRSMLPSIVGMSPRRMEPPRVLVEILSVPPLLIPPLAATSRPNHRTQPTPPIHLHPRMRLIPRQELRVVVLSRSVPPPHPDLPARGVMAPIRAQQVRLASPCTLSRPSPLPRRHVRIRRQPQIHWAVILSTVSSMEPADRSMSTAARSLVGCSAPWCPAS
mmetsp:Transcript_33253/g.98078  ORF Transcript_33253/g.98078 Transcript_33253/m.98078 type:complete len:398 (-) Transcript_33253:332-1525(-)